jgi:chromosomal replication initiation ATPase DnaA
MLDDWATWPAKRPRSAAAQARWQAVSDRVRDEMTKGNFAIYFSRSRGLGLAEVDGQLTLTVGAPNTSAAEGLDTQFARLIRRALDALGWPDLAVHVVVLPTMIDAQGDEVIDVDGALADIPDAPRDVRLVAQ